MLKATGVLAPDKEDKRAEEYTPERLKKIEDRYWKEFEKNDLAHVVVLRGGHG